MIVDMADYLHNLLEYERIFEIKIVNGKNFVTDSTTSVSPSKLRKSEQDQPKWEKIEKK